MNNTIIDIMGAAQIVFSTGNYRCQLIVKFLMSEQHAYTSW